jgi:hypothetical protein
MKSLRLIPVDLRRCCKGPGGPGGGAFHDHPDISTRKQYLIKFAGQYYAGMFTREWFGWNFDGVYDAGLQLDKPGTNCSDWQGLWEIRPRTKKRKKRKL